MFPDSESLCARGISVLNDQDDLYPEKLKHISNRPHELFFRGNMEALQAKAILCVVGSRDMTEYGRRVLEFLIPPLVEKGFVIVSGMAFGVDITAHQLTLKAKGVTVGVQAQGVDKGYPRAHQDIYEKILTSGGCILSEFPFIDEYHPEAKLFPRRNRILSGLSDAVLVVEAQEKSGTILTARYALEQDRDVYAVPAGIFSPQSAGCHMLIREGAKPVTKPQDILEDFGFEPIKAPVQRNLFETVLEEQIFALCLNKPLTLDDIVSSVSDAVPLVSATITKMALMGKLKEVEGRKFVAV